MTTNQLFPVYRLFVLLLDPWWTPLCWPFPLQPVGLRSSHRVTWLLHKWRLPLREFAHRTIMLRQMRRCSDMLNNKIDKAGFYKHIYSKNTRIHKYETKGWEKHERYLFMFITYMCVNIWIDSFVLILMFLVIIITFVSIRIKNTLCWCGHCDGCWRICCRRRGVCCCRQRSAVWITEIVFTAVWWTSSHHTL